jgi:hypothetical protein
MRVGRSLPSEFNHLVIFIDASSLLKFRKCWNINQLSIAYAYPLQGIQPRLIRYYDSGDSEAGHESSQLPLTIVWYATKSLILLRLLNGAKTLFQAPSEGSAGVR